MQRRHLLALAAAAAVTPQAFAQGKYPSRPITIVVPTAPGGSTDFTARLIADPLSRALGQPVIVDNKPGASGNIGNQFVARAKPDGYTLLLSYSGYHVGNPHLFKQAGWDPIKDFAPVAMLTRAPQVIAARPTLPVNNLKELIAYAKANPGKLNYASSGNGSIQHIAGELLKQLTGVFITHIPYKGSGPAVQDLMGGQVDLFITTPAGVVSQVQAGKLKALAVTSKQRLASMPNVPTAAESGLNGYELDSWFALYAPAGTPPEIVNQLNAEIAKILAMPEVKKKADDSGTAVETMTPAQFAAFTKKELDYWGTVIRKAKITAE
ncbi:Bug family tripartite tricarboxylate transporter substrate binding protein [Ramlibacter albus]|uniref:Tripartite tricarboxylate transporter substrate binding protein n=1 Tax=Ramlibacter albus TaxID=2079448 RepID=A0A923M8D3_9BURK|nr:tripartite tricarboxylate transporter substrate binding protein [Ramlibacter albus]MBC5764773.1 tripartite tricarboxylate transporter substrate binding protein [Ramlibacter albus]